MDCGAACLRMIAQYYGRYCTAQYIREQCKVTRDGVSLLGISEAAESLDFITAGVKITLEQLCNDIPLPCIVHWKQKHFVVVYRIANSFGKIKVKVADPACGLISYDGDEFCQSWVYTGKDECLREYSYGVALVLTPSSNFQKDNVKQQKIYNLVWIIEYFRPYRAIITQLVVAMIVSSLISFILPFITQAIVDTGIITGNIPFVVTLLLSQLVLIVGQVVNNLMRNWLMLHTSSRISIALVSDFLYKLLKLPINFFDKHMIGDIMQRIGDYNRIQNFFMGTILSIAIAMATFLVYAGIVASYDSVVLLVFFIGTVLYVAWSLIFLKRREKLDYQRFQESSSNQNAILQLISGIREIKLSNSENKQHRKWEQIQARLFRISIKSLSIEQAQVVGGTIIEQTKNIIITYLTATSVIEGRMTLGMMMSLQYIIGQLNAPIMQFVSFAQATQDATISLDRVNEVRNMADEETENEHKIHVIPCNTDIVFDNVTFQYEGLYSNKVLDCLSFRIPANKVTAIVGASGSGKTTMLKMMLGFYKPSSGHILLGDKPLYLYSEKEWRSHCGSVMQDGYIFSDTIACNISMAGECPDMQRVSKAANISNISRWVESLPMGYNTVIGDEGQGLSAGQKQRILIARAAYKNASYLFLDEATNSLDANNEKAIMLNLQTLFEDKTVVIVAHRLSTVCRADNIIVLEKGRVVEKGTHAQLISKKGKYFALVKNQLELGVS